MNAMLVYTASSCGVTASGIREIAPTVPCTVSSRVRPVNTCMAIFCSSAERRLQDWMSLDSGTFSGSQKLPVRRSEEHTSELQSRGQPVCRLLLGKKHTKDMT